MDASELTLMAESVETKALTSLYEHAPADVADRLGLAWAPVAGGVALAMREDPTGGHWNRTLGLGVTQPVDDPALEEALSFFRGSGVNSALVQIAPTLLPDDWEELRERHHLAPGDTAVKFARPAEALPPARTDLRVDFVEPAERSTAADVYLRGFGLADEGLRAMFTASFHRPELDVFAAWDGDTMVAASALFVAGESAILVGTGTLPEHRSRGAQSALLAARSRQAVARGVRWLFVETDEPESPGANHSHNNVTRHGFQPLYTRRSWRWTDA